MKKFIALSIIGLCLGFASPLWAEDGDVESKVCGQVQFAAQVAISPKNFKNHGQKVQTAAALVSPFVDSYEITEECSSCYQPDRP